MTSLILVTLMVGFMATKIVKLVRGKEDSLLIKELHNQHNTSLSDVTMRVDEKN